MREVLILAVQAHVYKHPGYQGQHEPQQPSTYVPHHAAIAPAEAQIKDYLTAIARSKVRPRG